MQHQDKSFPRAVNTTDLHVLGDPERWGGAGQVLVRVPTGVASDRTEYSPQLVRAQCADMVARAWELAVSYVLQGKDAGDTVTLTLHLTWGTGQNSAQGYITLPLTAIAPAGVFPWVCGAGGGSLQLPRPIPAVALAVRGKLQVVAAGGAAAHDVVASLSVNIAPRALI